MRSLAVTVAAAALLAAPSGAVAQGQGPFRPLPPAPTPPPEAPAPPDRSALEADDQTLGTLELLAIIGLPALLIAGVGVAIFREGRRRDRRARGRRARRTGRSVAPKKRGVAALGSRSPARSRRSDSKAPPPPPRKRRSKAKRRAKAKPR